MAKKKNSDFSKIKVKIGKSKPSNNATKFNIKTAKVVIPSDKANKAVIKKEDESYLSSEKCDLIENLKRMDILLSEYLGKKRNIMQKTPIDLTQSVWSTYYFRNWITPWDSVIQECNSKMGTLEQWFLVIIDSCASSAENTVIDKMLRTINLYLQLHGDTACGKQTSRHIIEIVKKYIKSVERGKRLMSVELLSLLAKYCPYSLWFHARRRTSIFSLHTIMELFAETKKTYESMLDDNKYLMLAVSIIYAALDGRKARTIIIGEDWSQIEDITKPPFTDLIYEIDEEMVDYEIAKVTDIKDKWDESILQKQADFNLEAYLTKFSANILDIGIKLLPVDSSCQESLEKTVRVVEILSRSCLRSETSKKWTEFVEGLMANFPYKYEAPRDDETEVEDTMDVDDDEETQRNSNMSRKDKKRRQQQLDLAKRMKELCRKAKTVKNVTAVHKLNDDLNYYTVALVHQSLVSEKITVYDVFDSWLNQVDQLIASCDQSQNDVTWRWLRLAKQMMALTFDRKCHPSTRLCNIFVAFSHDIFLTAHSLSKVKRLSLAVFVESCLGFLGMASGPRGAAYLPPVNGCFVTHLVTQILDEQQQADTAHTSVHHHPTFLSPPSSQTHHDMTLLKAFYLLLSVNYPLTVIGGTPSLSAHTTHTTHTTMGEMVAHMDAGTTHTLRTLCSTLRISIHNSQYGEPQRQWNRFKHEDESVGVPAHYYWDYFTMDDVTRKDGPKEKLKPLCSSVAVFIIK